MTTVDIPELCLVALVGISGAGKSTFAARHFGRFEVLSSDVCRGLVADDENDQSASKDAFEVLGFIAGKRLASGRLVVVDATNVTKDARRQLVELAKAHDVLPVAIVLDVPASVGIERNRDRAERDFGPHVVKRHHDLLRRSLRGLAREGFRRIHVLRGVEEIESATIVRTRLFNDHREDHGPFDVIGDVHGCRAELEALLGELGYLLVRDAEGRAVDASHPDGRRVIFLGDLVDRGPDSPGVLRLAMGMTAAGHALAVPGNHENKLIRALRGRQVRVSHGLAETLAQLELESAEFRDDVLRWCDGLTSHLILDGGRLVVAHAGLKDAYHGRASGRVRAFALYGDTTGETDEFGLPVRYPWAADYRGRAMVLYGHTPTPDITWVNNTLCLDTGCVFGGQLTALRYPEREVVQVDAHQVWYEPAKPLRAPTDVRGPDDLDLGDVLGRRVIQTAHHGRLTIRGEFAAGALEVMSRFAMHPRWLPHLPPTMAPTEAGDHDGLLEHPQEAFAAYAEDGVGAVVCEEKHMGSRAVLVVCRDAEVAARRFGERDGRTGVILTRTGRAALDRARTEALLATVRDALTEADLWSELETDWAVLDSEILPWSLKAEALVRDHFAPVAATARSALPVATEWLERAASRGLDVAHLLDRTRERASNAEAYAAAYGRFCWETDGLDGVQIAPFQILAVEGRVTAGLPHAWHLDRCDRLVAARPDVFRRTERIVVETASQESCAEGVRWWETLTGAGGEGMVVKPAESLVRGPRGLVQPGLKVRGREYLRIIYGPDYTRPDILARLRQRSLGRKKSLALREYALGLEALERFVGGEPLWRVHEPVFAILALESEPVDPRL